jgi:hypothetical protein
LFDVLDKQFGFERIGVVEIDLGALDGGQSAQVLVIGVVLKEGNSVRADALENLLCNGGLSGTRSACDTDDEGSSHASIIPAEKTETRLF